MSGHNDTKNIETTSVSTQAMIQSLKPEVVRELMQSSSPGEGNDKEENATVSTVFLNRLNKLGLGCDPRMINLIAAYPHSGNRLISVFKALKDLKINLTEHVEKVIAQNISNIGGAVNLLGVMNDLEINPNSVSIQIIFQAARTDSTVVQATRDLHERDLLDKSSFNLLLAYPEESLNISRLLIELQDHAYNPAALVDKLRASLISPACMNTTLNLLGLLLTKEIYDLDILDILARQEQFIDIIYEGARKLLEVPELLNNYFVLLERNPENANIFAKNLLLLDSASLISHCSSKEEFLKVSQLGIGAFHFMNYLQQAGMLNAENYRNICENNSLLERPDIVTTLTNLPLMTKFTREELEIMLELVAKPAISVTPEDANKFNEVLEEHQIHPHFGRAR
ncbi:hypothetical protein [Legionella parisiensis]|uniref:Uncharacterized protein n=1 Tax=Legionella parisiensis TaxID=45071 RepID=A0A1E5JS28_9GAMM|nr:hypothetical protein [Legionella parisiensis]KTD40878.1 hypothetical protein Lpar_2195 [Legionella parisiensis]OEH47315.1 hypothetical protein lpari_01628 [Legionella parisiensis]STX72180.1 Uncharacterised protein [Legionella parisiensis]